MNTSDDFIILSYFVSPKGLNGQNDFMSLKTAISPALTISFVLDLCQQENSNNKNECIPLMSFLGRGGGGGVRG